MPIQWDLGVADVAGSLAPTNSVVQQNAGTHPYTVSATNLSSDPQVVATHDVGVTFNTWRNNPAFLGAIMISADLPPNLMGDYHLASNASPAYNLGAANKSGVNAPVYDIDNQARPAFGAFDAGADEIAPVPVTAELSITNTDGVTTVNPGAAVNYTIVVANAGPGSVTGANVADNFPASLTVNAWTCTATAGSSCTATGTGNARTGTVTLASGGSATFTAGTTLSASATGTLANTATVAAPAGTTDPNTANNSATDTDTIVPATPQLPALVVLDNFNRANAANLNIGAPAGVSWSQTTNAGSVIRLNGNQANCVSAIQGGSCGTGGTAIWNGTTNVFGAKQGAAFTIVNNPTPSRLILKASGGSANAPASYIRVRSTLIGNTVVVETTTNSGGAFTTRGTFPVNLVDGDRLSAVANADGSVDVWRTTAANVTTYLGRGTAVAAFAGTGRIGMQLAVTSSVDNFAGGTLP